jgi:ABC-type antimicrobial peptide transport system permease subunit
VAYSVSRQTREIGVGMALGAERRSVVLTILRQAGKMVTLGVVVGLLGSLGLSRLMASMLFGVNSYDPLTFVAVAVISSAVALAACYVPARRASREISGKRRQSVVVCLQAKASLLISNLTRQRICTIARPFVLLKS